MFGARQKENHRTSWLYNLRQATRVSQPVVSVCVMERKIALPLGQKWGLPSQTRATIKANIWQNVTHHPRHTVRASGSPVMPSPGPSTPSSQSWHSGNTRNLLSRTRSYWAEGGRRGQQQFLSQNPSSSPVLLPTPNPRLCPRFNPGWP